MATLTVQALGEASAITMVAAGAGGDEFANSGGRGALMVTNGGGASITVTFDAPGTCSFGLAANAAHDNAVAVAAGATRLIKATDTVRYNDVDGNVQVTYSDVTSVTVAAVRL